MSNYLCLKKDVESQIVVRGSAWLSSYLDIFRTAVNWVLSAGPNLNRDHPTKQWSILCNRMGNVSISYDFYCSCFSKCYGVMEYILFFEWVYLGMLSRPVAVTTTTITFVVADPYQPSFSIVTGWGSTPKYTP